MSLVTKMFGKKKKLEKTPTLPSAIQELRQTEDLLLKKQSYLEAKINKEIGIAKNNASKNRKAALSALQRKKHLEKELQRIDGTLTTVENQIHVLDTANVNTTVVSSMGKASNALKAAQKCLSPEMVDDLLGDLQDQKEMTEEISDAISKPISFEEDIDEDELLKELEELELEAEEEVPELPEVPKGQLTPAKSLAERSKKEAVKV